MHGATIKILSPLFGSQFNKQVQRPGFSLRRVRMEFRVDEVVVGHAFLQYFGVTCQCH